MCSTTNNTAEDSKKRKRVPKRGPGVAELEKILREEENNNTSSNLQGRFSPFVSSSSSSSSSSSPSISVVVDHYLQQPHHQRYFPIRSDNINNNDYNKSISCMVGRHISDGVLLPEMKINYTSATTTTMTNRFPGWSSNLPPIFEPPSSQKQEEKFAGVKRPLTVENNNNNNNNHYRASLVPSKKLASSFNHGIGFDPNLLKPMPTREAKWDVTRECDYLPSYNTELINGVGDANFVRFISPKNNAITPVITTPFQSVQPQLPKFDIIPFQGNMRDQWLSQRSSGSDLDPNKPFFSFFPSNDQRNRVMFDMDNKIDKGNKAGQDGIDLNLKLSTT